MNAPNEAGRSERREALKATIRTVASTMFAERGFEETGVREIAAGAGVNPAIVIRHFGSKEALFLEAMSMDSWLAVALAGPLESVGQAVVASLVDGDDRSWRVYAALMRASGRTDVNALLQRTYDTQIAARLTPRLSGQDVTARIHLFTAQLIGLLTSFAINGGAHIRGASREQLIHLYGAAMQAFLTPFDDGSTRAMRT